MESHIVDFFHLIKNSVLTPYYKEDVLYSEEELHSENEDGISILFYLQKIYPGDSIPPFDWDIWYTMMHDLLIVDFYMYMKSDEWRNFEERMRNPKPNATEKDRTEAHVSGYRIGGKHIQEQV